MGKQRATDLASKVAIINAVETSIETNSEKLDATKCLGIKKSLSICLLHPSSSLGSNAAGKLPTRMWRRLFLAGLSRLGA